jgi:hypothetical protein
LDSLGGSFCYKNGAQMKKSVLGIYVRDDISVNVKDTLSVWVEDLFESFVVYKKRKHDVEIFITLIYWQCRF